MYNFRDYNGGHNDDSVNHSCSIVTASNNGLSLQQNLSLYCWPKNAVHTFTISRYTKTPQRKRTSMSGDKKPARYSWNYNGNEAAFPLFLSSFL